VAQTIEPRLLRGFRDYLPEVMIPRDRMVATITDVFQRFGFAPLATPCLEYADIILGKYGPDAEMLLYRFLDNGQRDVCMRYDLTVPLARVAAQYPDLPKPFKRYQVAPVWRAEKPGQGRFREFVQCDVDIVGTASLAADAECVQVDSAVMNALGVPDFQIRVNNRKVLEGLSALAGGADANRMKAVFRSIDKLDKQGPDAVRELLVSQDGLTPDQAARVLAFVSIAGSNAERMTQARELMAGVETAQKGLAELQTVLDLAVAGGVAPERVQVDLSIARGLDYYTGTVFETFLLGLPGFGSVMSGGRYDGLISLFIGKDMPAVGISVGLDRLLAGLIELKRVEAPKSVVEVYVAIFDEDSRPAAMALAARLRAAGLRVEVSYEAGKIGKQFKHADRLGARVALVIGPEERAQNAAALKDLRTGAQAVVPIEGIEARVRQALS